MPPVLASVPSEVTRRALTAIEPRSLYLLLGIDALAASDKAYAEMEADRRAALAEHARDEQSLRSAAKHLDAAWRLLPPQGRTDELAASVIGAHWDAELARLRAIAAGTRINRGGAELLEVPPLALATGRPDGKPCTEQDHAYTADPGEHVEVREVPGSAELFVACRYCGAIVGTVVDE